MKKRLKFNGILIFAAVMLVFFFPTQFLRSDRLDYFDEAIKIFGIAAILLGQLLRVSARGYKSENSQEGGVLVKSGPYTLVRHPMYLGILLIGMGISMVLFKLWVMVAFAVIFTLRYILLGLKEEEKLRSLFPQEYIEYRKQVPGIFPAPRSIFKRYASEYLPIKSGWIRKEIGTILAVLIVIFCIMAWKDIGNYGLRLYMNRAAAYVATLALFIALTINLDKETNAPEKS